MVLYESMHKFAVSLGVDGGGTKGKEAIMEVSANKPGPIGSNEGVVALSKKVSTVGMMLVGAVGPYRSW